MDAKCSKIDEIIEKQLSIIEKLKEYKLSIITEAVTSGINPDVEMKDTARSGDDTIRRIIMIPTSGFPDDREMKRSIRRLGAFQRYKGGVSCSTTSMSSIFTKYGY